MLTVQSENASPAARAYNQARISRSLEFHRERLAWITAPSPAWGDGVPVSNYDVRVYGEQSREAIEMLEKGLFVAGGDA